MKLVQVVCTAVIGVSMGYGGVAFAQDACADYEEHFDAPKTISQAFSAPAKEFELRMDCLGEKLDLSDQKRAELRKILESASRDQLVKRLSGVDSSAFEQSDQSASKSRNEAAIKDLELNDEQQKKLKAAFEDSSITTGEAASEGATDSGGDTSPKIVVIRDGDADDGAAKVIDVDKEVAELLDDDQLEGYREVEALRQKKLEEQREQRAKNRKKFQEYQEKKGKEAGEEKKQ